MMRTWDVAAAMERREAGARTEQPLCQRRRLLGQALKPRRNLGPISRGQSAQRGRLAHDPAAHAVAESLRGVLRGGRKGELRCQSRLGVAKKAKAIGAAMRPLTATCSSVTSSSSSTRPCQRRVTVKRVGLCAKGEQPVGLLLNLLLPGRTSPCPPRAGSLKSGRGHFFVRNLCRLLRSCAWEATAQVTALLSQSVCAVRSPVSSFSTSSPSLSSADMRATGSPATVKQKKK